MENATPQIVHLIFADKKNTGSKKLKEQFLSNAQKKKTF